MTARGSVADGSGGVGDEVVRRPPPLLLFLAVIVAGTLAGFVALETLWGERRLVSETLHATVEALGGLAALLMVAFLLPSRREAHGGKLFLLAMGFMGMGLLDVFHATTVPGRGFVLLHAVASLAGGSWFALVWLPRCASDADAPWKMRVPWVVAFGSLLFGVWTLAARQTLPAMVRDGHFTSAAIGIYLFAGALFLAAAARLALDSHAFPRRLARSPFSSGADPIRAPRRALRRWVFRRMQLAALCLCG